MEICVKLLKSREPIDITKVRDFGRASSARSPAVSPLSGRPPSALTDVSVRSINDVFRGLCRRIAHPCAREAPVEGTVETDESGFGPRGVRGKRGERGAGAGNGSWNRFFDTTGGITPPAGALTVRVRSLESSVVGFTPA